MTSAPAPISASNPLNNRFPPTAAGDTNSSQIPRLPPTPTRRTPDPIPTSSWPQNFSSPGQLDPKHWSTNLDEKHAEISERSSLSTIREKGDTEEADFFFNLDTTRRTVPDPNGKGIQERNGGEGEVFAIYSRVAEDARGRRLPVGDAGV